MLDGLREELAARGLELSDWLVNHQMPEFDAITS